MSMERWPGGQQLYAARHRAELSAEDAGGVSVDTVGAVEVGTPVKSDVTAAMCALHCYAAEVWCMRRL
jgi:hypothetical protein